jgi:hypothetical protein
MEWTQASLDDFVRTMGQPNSPTPPGPTIEDVMAEVRMPPWRREMDPRDREWLETIESRLQLWA